MAEYENLKAQYDRAAEKISSNESKMARWDHFIEELKKAGFLITKFDERLWSGLMTCITVHSKEDIRFMFKDGTEICI